ncbi:MAG: hypothetical protein ACI4OJ_12350 [Lachnospiraceae bacterium]
MKKAAVIGSTLAAVLAAGALAVPAFAASNPADDAESYSYSAGRQAYAARMAEDHPWYDNEEDAVIDGYSFQTGVMAAADRNNAFAELPAGDDLTDEELDAFFKSHGIGTGLAYADGTYDASAKADYGYAAGQSTAKQRQSTFSQSE